MSDDSLAKSFDSVADEYDKHRSSYPSEVIDDILGLVGDSRTNLLACEIGCGTGQATRDFATRGISITAVDPGAKLIERARRNLQDFSNVRFVNLKFEDVELPEASFDLVYAAQSFHWVDSFRAHSMVSRLLRPGGLFAAFWKCESPIKDELHRKLDSLYQQYLPDYQPANAIKYEQSSADDLKALLESKLFYLCQLRRYPQPSTDQDSKSFSDAISTWSMIAALDPTKRNELLEKVCSTIDSDGGTIKGGRAEVLMICGYSGPF